MNLTCRQLAELLHDFVSGELADEANANIQVHLDGCPPCVAYVESYRITIQVTKSLSPRPMPESLQAKLAKMLEQVQAEQAGS